MGQLSRIGIAIPEELLAEFDQLIERRGYAARSAMHDLVRKELVDEIEAPPTAEVYGAVTLVYDHHARLLLDKTHRPADVAQWHSRGPGRARASARLQHVTCRSARRQVPSLKVAVSATGCPTGEHHVSSPSTCHQRVSRLASDVLTP